VAFFFRRVGGSAVFFAAVTAQAIVIAMYLSLNLGYLWYKRDRLRGVHRLSVSLQTALGPRVPQRVGRPALIRSRSSRSASNRAGSSPALSRGQDPDGRRLQAEMGGRIVLLP
jgi:hypothetical protein